MRIIAGQWKGKPLVSPEGRDIRPTSDRARESLFNLLMHLDDNPVIDQPVVDLCCGSGALGLEALSRGASHCTFIDNSPQALKLVQHNVDRLHANRLAKTLLANASQLPSSPAPVSLALMDPPYQHPGLMASAYESLRKQGWLQTGGYLSVEQSFRTGLISLPGAEILKQRRYGKSEIIIYRLTRE